MNKGMTKKKKTAAVVIVSVLSLILCFGIGVYIWYSNSPFSTALKMMSALKEKDIDTVLECIEPETSQKLKMLLNLTGISADDLMDKFLSANSGDGENEKPQAEGLSVEFSGYERDGDTACISFKTESDDESARFDIRQYRTNPDKRQQSLYFCDIIGTWINR